jgi:hypothetical protein
VRRHGIVRQLQPASSGSTPLDRVTILQIGSSRSPPLDRPRQGAPSCPPVVANRPAIHRARRHPPLIRQPLHRRTTCWTGSIPTNQLARGTQIPIAPAAPPYVPLSAVSSLGGFRTLAAEHAAPSLMRPASETLTQAEVVICRLLGYAGWRVIRAARLSAIPPRIAPGHRHVDKGQARL